MFVRNVHLAIEQYGHDEDYIPTNPCSPTDAKPGTPEKIAVLCERVQLGQPLWHEDDEVTLGALNHSAVALNMIKQPIGPRARKCWTSEVVR